MARDLGLERFHAQPKWEIPVKDVVPKDPNVAFEHRLISGDPATAISRLAESEGVDMIILGTHGRTGLMRAVMGSVAEAIVRHAACPVLTFKQPNK